MFGEATRRTIFLKWRRVGWLAPRIEARSPLCLTARETALRPCSSVPMKISNGSKARPHRTGPARLKRAGSGANPRVPSRIRRSRSPARPCSRRASRRRGWSPSANGRGGPHDLRALAAQEVGPEMVGGGVVAVGAHRDYHRRAGMPVPDLGRVDPVPGRSLADAEQVVDRGADRASLHGSGIAKGLAVMTALGMRFEPERVDHLGGRQTAGHWVSSSLSSQRTSQPR